VDSEQKTGEHIWLRQSVRFTVGDQERTLEIAIPVRPGAPADEIERLLREADAGMAHVTHHLDMQVAALVAPDAAPASDLPAVAQPREVIAPEPAPARASTPPAAAPARPRPETPAPADHPPAAQPTPAAPASSPAPSRTAQPAPARAPTPAPATPSAPPAPTARPDATPLTRPAFLAETRALGLTPPQVMERLGVRSLDGLNLDEALEVLRRQLVRDDAAPSQSAPRSPSTSAAPTAAPAAPARAVAPPEPEPARAGTFFDEEDDFDVTFAVPGDEPDDDEFDLDESAANATDGLADVDMAGELDLAGLEDVPDFSEPTAAPTAGAQGATRAVRQRARAREVLAKLQAAPAGGTPSRLQLSAYTNIVVGQLDPARAATLAQGVWGAAADRLGTDQLNALIQWGKEDGFAEEAPNVLALLRAEQAARGAGAEDAASRRARPARTQGTRRPDPQAGGMR
jgi:hypothetical protein